uniref:Uncharacterized protein n=1 Tax=Anguilla anguilla TaxID=7936 RepID=A0A0E9RLU0_ANGAN
MGQVNQSGKTVYYVQTENQHQHVLSMRRKAKTSRLD